MFLRLFSHVLHNVNRSCDCELKTRLEESIWCILEEQFSQELWRYFLYLWCSYKIFDKSSIFSLIPQDFSFSSQILFQWKKSKTHLHVVAGIQSWTVVSATNVLASYILVNDSLIAQWSMVYLCSLTGAGCTWVLD